MREIYSIFVTGAALGCAWFWIVVLIGIISKFDVMERWKRWLPIAVLQGIIIVLALRELKLLQ